MGEDGVTGTSWLNRQDGSHTAGMVFRWNALCVSPLVGFVRTKVRLTVGEAACSDHWESCHGRRTGSNSFSVTPSFLTPVVGPELRKRITWPLRSLTSTLSM